MADYEMATLDDYVLRLRDIVVGCLNGERLRLERNSADVARSAAVMVNGLQHRLDNMEESIATYARSMIRSEQQRIESHMQVVENNNPENILRRGFALVRGIDGQTINPQNIEPGTHVSIVMNSGTLTAEIKSKHLR
jgi:exodeoxyribonuclease VII large subunit